jgi:uncharacterized protein
MISPAALLVTGSGEETGWRGYALARLQRRSGPVRASLIVTAGWAVWHVPLFFLLAGYAGFGPLMAVGWLAGLAAGALVLTATYNWAGGSILAVAFWHATYDLGSATAAGDGLVAAVVTAGVIFWAATLVRRDRTGRPAFGEPPARSSSTRASGW